LASLVRFAAAWSGGARHNYLALTARLSRNLPAAHVAEGTNSLDHSSVGELSFITHNNNNNNNTQHDLCTL